MGKKMMWGLVAAAVIALAVLNFAGIIPPKEGIEGTVGAAKRYSAAQISDSDVALGDTSVQEFIQSPVFEQMMRDDNVRRALASPGVAAALGSPGVAAMLAKPGVAAALASPGVAAALVSPAPKATKRMLSPGLTRPASTASHRAIGMEAAEVLPYLSMSINILSGSR